MIRLGALTGVRLTLQLVPPPRNILPIDIERVGKRADALHVLQFGRL